MADKIVYDVDLIRDVKLLLVSNTDVTVDNTLRNKIKTLNDDTLVRVGKKLGSLIIVSIDVVDIAFLDYALK